MLNDNTLVKRTHNEKSFREWFSIFLLHFEHHEVKIRENLILKHNRKANRF
jgi:hypothetical protein